MQNGFANGTNVLNLICQLFRPIRNGQPNEMKPMYTLSVHVSMPTIINQCGFPANRMPIVIWFHMKLTQYDLVLSFSKLWWKLVHNTHAKFDIICTLTYCFCSNCSPQSVVLFIAVFGEKNYIA